MEDEFLLELSKNIQAYKDFVFEDFWKTRNFSRAGGLYSPNRRCDHFNAENVLSSKIFNESKLAYNGAGLFLHYTSLSNLVSILKSQTIRLYDFNNFNDPTEFIYTHKLFKKYQGPNDLREYRRQLFGLSLCEYSEDLVCNSMDLWRLYADDGMGVCITFEISEENRNKMTDYTIGKIQYCSNTSKIDELEKIIERDREFALKNDFRCSNLAEVVTPLCCFYKPRPFEIENEVRLFHFSEKTPYCRHKSKDVKPELNRKGKKVYYIELPIASQQNPFIPFPKIKTVHFGYKLSQEDIQEFNEVFSEIDFPYKINFEISPLKNYFST